MDERSRYPFDELRAPGSSSSVIPLIYLILTNRKKTGTCRYRQPWTVQMLRLTSADTPRVYEMGNGKIRELLRDAAVLASQYCHPWRF